MASRRIARSPFAPASPANAWTKACPPANVSVRPRIWATACAKAALAPAASRLAWKRGDLTADAAADELYAELRRRARAHLRRESSGHTLSPTDLVHDIYLKLSRQKVDWSNREQFYATASRMMRRVLVDHARAKRAQKRAGLRIELDEDERQARLVELRFFGGLTLEEAAATLAISLPTAKRDWRFARAWLARRLGFGKPATG